LDLLVTFEYISEYRFAKIVVPTIKAEPPQLECLVRVATPPLFEASFEPGVLPVHDIDSLGKCQLYLPYGSTNINIHAYIEKVVNSEKLILGAIETATCVQKREFFRVDTSLNLKYRILGQGLSPQQIVTGRVNISAGGMRIPVNEPVAENQRLRMLISLPDPVSKVVGAEARVVRFFNFGHGNYEAALEFVNIDAVTRDQIAAFCLSEQRRQLRTKVRVVG